jgi:hypothetical protein
MVDHDARNCPNNVLPWCWTMFFCNVM